MLTVLMCASKRWRNLASEQQLWEILSKRESSRLTKAEHHVAHHSNANLAWRFRILNGGDVVLYHPWRLSYIAVMDYRKRIQDRQELHRNHRRVFNSCRSLGYFMELSLLGEWNVLWFWVTFFIFVVLLPVKLDSPSKFSWWVTFTPLFIYDFALMFSICSYWFMFFHRVVPLKREYGMDELNLVLTTMTLTGSFRRKFRFQAKILNTCWLMLWMLLTFLVPLLLENNNYIIKIVVGMVSTSLSATGIFYWAKYFKLKFFAYLVDTNGVEKLFPVGFLSILFSFLTIILWMIHFWTKALGSYANVMIFMFFSDVIILVSPVAIYVYLRKIRSLFAGVPSWIWSSVLVVIFGLLQLSFHVLLVLHIDHLKFTAVVVFIPVWIQFYLAWRVIFYFRFDQKEKEAKNRIR
eukprot:TRINITY_DN4924_c1_g1_i2.p1 TRINITY_DN4924_c1_g1~~TRINITY_DN4924_c1_g1_i2.p1  ORF type:complete len:407 (+),score=67.81 TRINITY_DN4924_c1_g1_i2:1021-2241(+)